MHGFFSQLPFPVNNKVLATALSYAMDVYMFIKVLAQQKKSLQGSPKQRLFVTRLCPAKPWPSRPPPATKPSLQCRNPFVVSWFDGKEKSPRKLNLCDSGNATLSRAETFVTQETQLWYCFMILKDA